MSSDIICKSYITISNPQKNETVISKSRFIAECFPILKEDEALSFLHDVKTRYWDATHHCYAYSLGAAGEYSRYSDDGEPAGTAGLPILEAIRYAGVTNTICIVTRYFGGVLLGTGGLVKAYSGACKNCLLQAEKIYFCPAVEMEYKVPYSRYSLFTKIVEKYTSIDSAIFQETVICRFHIKKESESQLLFELTEKSNGQLSGTLVSECMHPFSK